MKKYKFEKALSKMRTEGIKMKRFSSVNDSEHFSVRNDTIFRHSKINAIWYESKANGMLHDYIMGEWVVA